MNKDDIRLLYEYDRWSNNRVLQAAAALNDEQFTRDLGGQLSLGTRHPLAYHRRRVGLAGVLEGVEPR